MIRVIVISFLYLSFSAFKNLKNTKRCAIPFIFSYFKFNNFLIPSEKNFTKLPKQKSFFNIDFQQKIFGFHLDQAASDVCCALLSHYRYSKL